MRLYYVFLVSDLAIIWRINMSFHFVWLWQTIFFYRDKDRTPTYRRLTGFVASFAFLGFLDTRSSMGLSFFFQYLWFLSIRLPLGQGHINLIFGFLGCYLLRWGLLDNVTKRFASPREWFHNSPIQQDTNLINQELVSIFVHSAGH